MEMGEPHTTAERQRLKGMLCDAVRVLCQNTVRYSVHLSVEALIGITVDGGKDSLIFSLHEIVDKNATAAGNEEEYYNAADDSRFDHADYVEEENADCIEVEDDIDECSGGNELYMPYGTVIKEEVMSTISYNNVAHNHHQQAITTSAMPHYKTEPFATEQYYDDSVNQWATGLPRRSTTAVNKTRTPGFGVQKQTRPASHPGVKKVEKPGTKVSQFGSRQQKPAALQKMQLQSLNGEDVVSQLTLYTCGTCGSQMSNHNSFQRHKQSHVVQQAFGCEGCGRMIKRRDNLRKHQRGCEAYLSKFQHSDFGL